MSHSVNAAGFMVNPNISWSGMMDGTVQGKPTAVPRYIVRRGQLFSRFYKGIRKWDLLAPEVGRKRNRKDIEIAWALK